MNNYDTWREEFIRQNDRFPTGQEVWNTVAASSQKLRDIVACVTDSMPIDATTYRKDLLTAVSEFDRIASPPPARELTERELHYQFYSDCAEAGMLFANVESKTFRLWKLAADRAQREGK